MDTLGAIGNAYFQSSMSSSSQAAATPQIRTFTLRTRRVMLGTHNFGPALVTFTANNIEWYPAESYALPDGSYPLVSVPITSIVFFQIDKQMGGLAFWTMHEPPFQDQLGEKWAPFRERSNPESSIFIEYDVKQYEKAGSNPMSNPSWPSEIVKLSDKLRRHAMLVGPGMILGRRRRAEPEVSRLEVTLPEGVVPGQKLLVPYQNSRFSFTVPPHGFSGMKMVVSIPPRWRPPPSEVRSAFKLWVREQKDAFEQALKGNSEHFSRICGSLPENQDLLGDREKVELDGWLKVRSDYMLRFTDNWDKSQSAAEKYIIRLKALHGFGRGPRYIKWRQLGAATHEAGIFIPSAEVKILPRRASAALAAESRMSKRIRTLRAALAAKQEELDESMGEVAGMAAELERKDSELASANASASRLRGENLHAMPSADVDALEGELRQTLKRVHAKTVASAEDCVICFSAAKEIVFLPCRHQCCCDECAPDQLRCPLCRVDIQQRMAVFR